MKSFNEWRIDEAKLSREKWGYEISGTVAEVIRILQKAPPDKECVASVNFWSDEEYKRRNPNWAGKPRTP